MSRRSISKRRYPKPDATYNSTLVSLLIARILKSGKKTLAQNIVNDTFDVIKYRLNIDPLEIFETAVRNVTPIIEVKAKRFGGATYQVPMEVRPKRAQTLAMKWIVDSATKRNEKTMRERVANEIIDAFNNKGNAVKKREETHKMAQANRAFAHLRW